MPKAMNTTSPPVVRKQSKKSKLAKAPVRRAIPPIVYYSIIGLVIVSFALIRLRLRDMPLERDEGEYAYAGQLILQGVPPYRLAYNMKLPGTYAAYALILAGFGQTPAAVHYGLILVNAATTFLVFLLASRLFGALAGVVSGTSYALLSTSPAVLGFAGHATHFVVLPAVGGILLLLSAIESKDSKKFLWSGVLMGLAFVMKQPGIFFILFSALYIVKGEFKRPIDYRGLIRRLGLFLVGAGLPFAVTCLWMLGAGVFQKFWFWTFSYASQYGTRLNLPEGMENLSMVLPHVLGPGTFVWILAFFGLTALWWSPKGRAHAVFLGGFLLFSVLALSTGLYFREHYFILILPAVALLVGLVVTAAEDSLTRYGLVRVLPIVMFLAACVYSIVDQSEFLFDLDPIEACRQTYGPNPFPEAIKIADYIQRHSSDSDKIAVLGSEPEIYFYAHRRSATGYVYTYPLMEVQEYARTMEKEMVKEIEDSRPEFLVAVDVPYSWLARPDSDTSIFEWVGKYSNQYERVGIVDIGQTSEYRWGDEAMIYRPRSLFTVSIFKRRAQ